MVLKTFNVEEETYKKFSEYCRANGLSMSKQIEFFINAQIAEEPKVRKEYLDKLEKIKKSNFVKIGSFGEFEKRYK